VATQLRRRLASGRDQVNGSANERLVAVREGSIGTEEGVLKADASVVSILDRVADQHPRCRAVAVLKPRSNLIKLIECSMNVRDECHRILGRDLNGLDQDARELARYVEAREILSVLHRPDASLNPNSHLQQSAHHVLCPWLRHVYRRIVRRSPTSDQLEPTVEVWFDPSARRYPDSDTASLSDLTNDRVHDPGVKTLTLQVTGVQMNRASTDRNTSRRVTGKLIGRQRHVEMIAPGEVAV
jgi:hypothetical protein